MELLKNSGLVILNRDCKYFHKLKKVNNNYLTYGFRKSDLTIKKYRLYFDHTYIMFNYQNKDYHIVSPLIGKYNVYNLMASFLVMLGLNYYIEDIIKRVSLIKTIKGRNEIVYHKYFTVMIDHAHTINATRSILKFVKRVKKGRLITILGCAGNRYKEKRSIIGKIALKYSDIVIFTMDDPYDEEPNKIIDEMLKRNRFSFKKYYRIVDRKKALEKAIELAKSKDFVLVLGRGRDKVMHLKNKDIIHNDYIELKKILSIR